MRIAILISTCLMSTGLQALDCKFEKTIDQTLDLTGSESLSISAAAGDLGVTGVKDSSVVSIRGRVCVSKEEWLDESRVETSGGKRAEIAVELPDAGAGWTFTGLRYAYLDLELEVPDGITLKIKDSSGDVEIEQVGQLSLQDSSGDIEIRNAGELTVRDSSGDIEIEDTKYSVTVWDSSGDMVLRDIKGGVTIESDSSGEIRGQDIEGSVLVKSDSSGDIRFSDVGENFMVERDSSGDISANRVGGDFQVLKDSSGEINATNINGDVSVPRG
jgi:hypothetical protein